LTNPTLGFKDDSNGTLAGDPTDDYQYDLNGNMTQDENKNITYITYNHLNLPVKIYFFNPANTPLLFYGNSYIEYIYDATGTKIKKNVFTVSPANTLATSCSKYVAMRSLQLRIITKKIVFLK
jgi:hypothetical protein